jgi:recombination protein RecR
MNTLPKALTRLIESFGRLPGVGPKTAQRLAFYLLHVPQHELDTFASNLTLLKSQTVLCSVCKNVAEKDPCPICESTTRDHSIICVVERPTDVLSIEKTGVFRGLYHVLHGAIDPLNNIGPDELYIDDLMKRIKKATEPISEIIIATNPNMEGEATAMYLHKLIGDTIKVTRLAHGLPVGGDLEYADEVTLTRALDGRREY